MVKSDPPDIFLWCDNLSKAACGFPSEMNSCSGDSVDSAGAVGLLWPTHAVKTGALKLPAPSYWAIWLRGEGDPRTHRCTEPLLLFLVHSLQRSSALNDNHDSLEVADSFSFCAGETREYRNTHTNKCCRRGWNPELTPRWMRGSSSLSCFAHNLTILVHSCSEPLQAAAFANTVS